MSNNCINYLREVNSKPELVKEVNALIKKLDFRAYGSNINYWNDRSHAAKELSKAFEELSHSYNISKESIIFYYSLDKKIFPKTGYYELPFPRFQLYFNGIDSSFHLDGESIAKAFRENERGPIDFCFNYCELFPDSSRKYIEKQKSKVEGIMKIDRISNKFQSKTLKYNLNDTFNYTQLSRNINSFSKLSDRKELSSSLLNFFTIVNEKYTDNSNRAELAKLNSKILTKIHNILKSCFSDANIKEYDRQILSLILEYIKDDKICLDFLFEKLSNKNSKMHKRYFFFSYSLAIEDKYVKMLDDYLLYNTQLEVRNTSFPFTVMTKDTKSAILKDIKDSWDRKLKVKYSGLYT